MGKPEAHVEQYLVQECLKRGVFETKFTSPGKRGMPDRVCIGNGFTVFVETKAPDGKPSELQKLRNKQINEHGGIAVFAYTREAVDEILDKYFGKNPATEAT